MAFLNRGQRQLAMYVLLALLAVWVLSKLTGRKSFLIDMQRLRPVDLSAKYAQEGDLFSLPYKLECTPGLMSSDSYLSMGLTPGGICGDQALIRKQMREYSIDSGVGGGLLEKF
ncbi:hypothetical protein EBT31_05685 [bacterium]|nr:hypothetical protein [bacterium]